jgi:hypothetical protein
MEKTIVCMFVVFTAICSVGIAYVEVTHPIETMTPMENLKVIVICTAVWAIAIMAFTLTRRCENMAKLVVRTTAVTGMLAIPAAAWGFLYLPNLL